MRFIKYIQLIVLLLLVEESAGQTDSARLCKQILLTEELILQDYPKSVQRGDKLLEESKKSTCVGCLTRAFILKGKISWNNGDYRESVDHLKQALTRATKTSDLVLLADATNVLGNNFYYQAYYDSAIYYFQQSYSYYEKLGDHTGMASVLGDISLMYHRKGDFGKTIQYILKDEAMKEKFPDTPHEIGDFGGMSNFFSDSLYYDEAIADNLRALKVQLKKNNAKQIFVIYLNLGMAYRQLKNHKAAARYFVKMSLVQQQVGHFPYWDYAGVDYRHANMKDSCLYYHYKAKSEFKRATDIKKLFTHQLLGEAHDHFGDYDSALYHFKIAMKMNSDKNNRITIVGMHRRLGDVLLKMKRYKESEEQILLGLALAREVSFTNEGNLYKDAAELYTTIGDYKQALYYQTQYSNLIDSLDRQESALTLVRLQAQYKTSKKERELDLLKIQNTQNELVLKNRTATLLSLAVISLASIVFIIIFARQRNKIRRKNVALDLSNKEQAVLLKEVHHRVKNNLQLISSLINLQASHANSEEVARELEKSQSRIMSIALIHQKLYQHENMSSIDLRSFLEDLVENILTTFSAGIKLEKYLDIDPVKVDIETAIPIGLIANELVTNSLKHGLSETEDPELKVRLERYKSKLVLTISDNGSGSKRPTSKEGGFGLRLVEILLKRLSGTIETTFKDGTHSKIEITNFQLAGPEIGQEFHVERQKNTIPA